MKQPFIIATAGHVDHGKSTLVKAMTGVDPDRWKEEQARGMTLDLGFVQLDENISIIDVPGHEKLVRHMVAGAATVSAVMLIVAADEGVMPQTREHVQILKLLGVSHGLVVLTKVGKVEGEWLELVQEDVAEYLEEEGWGHLRIYPVDSLTRQGIDAVEEAIRSLADELEAAKTTGVSRLHVDRSFSVPGFGTVVTGSVISGTFDEGEEVDVLPLDKRVRIRNIQVHDADVGEVRAGKRAALCLTPIKREEIGRGSMVVRKGALTLSSEMDVRLTLLPTAPEVKHRSSVRLHLGTAEVDARLMLFEGKTMVAGEEALGRLVLEEPLAAMRGDRFVVRRPSPVRTLGGGEILDPAPIPDRPKAQIVRSLKASAAADERSVVLGVLDGAGTMPRADLLIKTSLPSDTFEALLATMIDEGDVTVIDERKGLLATSSLVDELVTRTHNAVSGFHANHTHKPGMPLAELLSRLTSARVPEAVARLVVEGELARGTLVRPSKKLVATATHTPRLPQRLVPGRDAMLRTLETSGTTPPALRDLADGARVDLDEARDILAFLIDEGLVTMITTDLPIATQSYDRLKAALKKLMEADGVVTVRSIRDEADTSRKVAVPFLEHCDRLGYTVRRDNERIPGSRFGDL